MNTQVCAAFLAMSLTIAGAANADSRYNVTVENRSGIAIDQIYMSRVTDPNWRNDLLGSVILWSGYDTTILKGWGHYDVKLVDGDGDDCVVNDVAIQGDGTLMITGEWLLRCEGYG
jgi:hypothetical protein